MRFELVPEAAESAERAAQAALALAGLAADSDPPAYRAPWRQAALVEAAGHADELNAGAAVDTGTQRRDSVGDRTASGREVEQP